MKKHLLFYFFIISFSTFSKQGNFITENEYEYRKSNKLLKGDEIIITEDMINPGSFKNNVNYIKKIQLEKDGCQGYTEPIGNPTTLTALDD